MRVAAFKDVWIDQVIEEDTRVGKEISTNFLNIYYLISKPILVVSDK